MQRKGGSTGKVGIKVAFTMGGEEGTISLCFSYAGALFCHGGGFGERRRKDVSQSDFGAGYWLLSGRLGVLGLSLSRLHLAYTERAAFFYLCRRHSRCSGLLLVPPYEMTNAEPPEGLLLSLSTFSALTDPAVLPRAANGDFEARGQQASPGDGGVAAWRLSVARP